jgi:hypothetical protein
MLTRRDIDTAVFAGMIATTMLAVFLIRGCEFSDKSCLCH